MAVTTMTSAPEALMLDARELVSSGAFDSALEVLTRVIDTEPTCWNAYSLRGRAHLMLGHIDEAIRDLSVVIDRSEKPVSEVFWWRARAYLARKQYPQAEADLSAGLSRCTDDWRLWAWRGYARYRLGAFSRALNDFMESIYRQADGIAYLGRAFVYTKMHAQSSARCDFSKYKLNAKVAWDADEDSLESMLIDLFESPLEAA